MASSSFDPHVVGGKRTAQQIDLDKEILEIIPLGGGAEVGRSCHLLKFKGKTIMLDCGIHPAYTGIAALPFFDMVDPAEIDMILISHFHLDHAAALPYALREWETFRGKVYMTHPTKSVYKLLLQDFVKVSAVSEADTLFTEHDVLASMDRITPVNFHEAVHHQGIQFWAYNAGHVLGGAMFLIEIAGVKILYTGDYSRTEDRHLMAAELPDVQPDVLIVESTFGVQVLEPIKAREKLFTDLVANIVSRGGRCLIPAFALGRAQELLLLLDEYWEANRQLQGIPIYYASMLANKCMQVYQTYSNMMNRRIREQSSSPFVFKHIQNLRQHDMIDHSRPCVVLASPGFMQNGLSRELFELWCPDPRNGLIVAGYAIDGTLIKQVMNEPSRITTMSGMQVDMRLSVHSVPFAAHADYAETSDFIRQLRPNHVVMVHGDQATMMRMKQKLMSEFDGTGTLFYSPRNCQSVELQFQAQKVAKTVGSLAARAAQQLSARTAGGKGLEDAGSLQPLGGLLVRKDFSYRLMSPDEVRQFTPLSSAAVSQSLKLPFYLSFETMCRFVARVFRIRICVPDTPEAREERRRLRARRAQEQADFPPAQEDQRRWLEEKERLEEAATAAAGASSSPDGAVKSESTGVKREAAGLKLEAAEQAGAAGDAEDEDEEDGMTLLPPGLDQPEQSEKPGQQPGSSEAQGDEAKESQLARRYPSILVNRVIRVVRPDDDHLVLQWPSNPVNDMVADSLVCLLMTLQSTPGAAQAFGSHCQHRSGTCGSAHTHNHDHDHNHNHGGSHTAEGSCGHPEAVCDSDDSAMEDDEAEASSDAEDAAPPHAASPTGEGSSAAGVASSASPSSSSSSSPSPSSESEPNGAPETSIAIPMLPVPRGLRKLQRRDRLRAQQRAHLEWVLQQQFARVSETVVEGLLLVHKEPPQKLDGAVDGLEGLEAGMEDAGDDEVVAVVDTRDMVVLAGVQPPERRSPGDEGDSRRTQEVAGGRGQSPKDRPELPPLARWTRERREFEEAVAGAVDRVKTAFQRLL